MFEPDMCWIPYSVALTIVEDPSVYCVPLALNFATKCECNTFKENGGNSVNSNKQIFLINMHCPFNNIETV